MMEMRQQQIYTVFEMILMKNKFLKLPLVVSKIIQKLHLIPLQSRIKCKFFVKTFWENKYVLAKYHCANN